MCDTTYHREEDTILLDVTPAEMGQRREHWLARLRSHPYADECCSVELVGDGLVRPITKFPLFVAANLTAGLAGAFGIDA